MDIEKKETSQKKLYFIYIFFTLSFLCSFNYSLIASTISIMFCVLVLSVIYSLRSRSDEDSFEYNHYTYLIRTFWLANLYLAIFMVIAGFYMAASVDYTPLISCLSVIDDSIMSGSLNSLQIIMQPCIPNFINVNTQPLILSALIAFLPAIIYFGFRFIRGIRLVMRLE